MLCCRLLPFAWPGWAAYHFLGLDELLLCGFALDVVVLALHFVRQLKPLLQLAVQWRCLSLLQLHLSALQRSLQLKHARRPCLCTSSHHTTSLCASTRMRKYMHTITCTAHDATCVCVMTTLCLTLADLVEFLLGQLQASNLFLRTFPCSSQLLCFLLSTHASTHV